MRHNAEWMVQRDAASGLARWNGHISPARLTKLCEEMGVKWPVRIKRMAGTKRMGTHRCEPCLRSRGQGISYRHAITISTYISVYQANATLKHELQHAVQVERAVAEGLTPREWNQKEYAANRGRGHAGYRSNPYEVEAREASLKYEDAIVQNPLLPPLRAKRAKEALRPAYAPYLLIHQQREARESDLPVLREHYAAHLAEIQQEADIAPVITPKADAMIEQDAREAFRRRAMTALAATEQQPPKQTEREQIEARLKAWRAERKLPMPNAAEWNAMIAKQLARTSVQGA